MARGPVPIALSYVAGRGEGLKAEQQAGCRDAAEAARKAERVVALHEGVIAYSVSADVETGDCDENPVVLVRAGRSPPPWDDA